MFEFIRFFCFTSILQEFKNSAMNFESGDQIVFAGLEN